ncbi:TetR/AcrR family transcriptional regulator [Hymenobacter tibetensis]|uniref:TetR/AcrR family transcriptional regulator n=1 Tax=Hymenobacter tibetensis TaxID=497967 RepID=A0ABY4CT10_9BACT|nr:TetR/AcrR family transcriptional regulator [Hymenobacter tibetensis]UOG73177.1 TetR/AcrR family transcriptional regulator [Hymenobacter tibetensis]
MPLEQPATLIPDTRTRILNVAEQLLLNRGFNAFSYQHIAKELEVKPAAIHYHYPAKEDLGVAIIQRQRKRLNKWRNLPRLTDLPAQQQLEALFEVYLGHVQHEQRVCLFGSLAAEFRTLPEAMQQELRLLTLELTDFLAGVLEAGRVAGTLVFKGQPTAKAAQVLTTLAGALQMARVHDERQFHLVFEQLRLELLPE